MATEQPQSPESSVQPKTIYKTRSSVHVAFPLPSISDQATKSQSTL